MFFYEGFSCPVCNKPFAPDDDVVACPTCGAPHHRDCWKREGHCHFEADHGTDRQWSRDRQAEAPSDAATATASAKTRQAENQRPCPHCGHLNPTFAEFCAHCGEDTDADDWESEEPTTPPGGYAQHTPYGEYRPFQMVIDPYGGVSPDEEIDGVKAAELATFAGSNSAYYLPKFQKMEQNNSKCSWNWAAFLLTPYWLLFRKQYIAGMIALICDMAYTMLTTYIMYGVMGLHKVDAMQTAATMLDAGNGIFFLILFAAVAFRWLLGGFFGLFGNWLYLRSGVSRIRKLKADNPAVGKIEIAAEGGVSFGLALVAYTLLNIASLVAQTTLVS